MDAGSSVCADMELGKPRGAVIGLFELHPSADDEGHPCFRKSVRMLSLYLTPSYPSHEEAKHTEIMDRRYVGQIWRLRAA
jgi:hypothetical protein